MYIPSTPTDGTTLNTGGAGFIGSNLARRLLSQGQRVRILDSLARPGVERNLRWLKDQFGGRLEHVSADIRAAGQVAAAAAGVDAIFYLAAQVAVTTSVLDPRLDFAVNALGTLNVLEAARRQSTPPVVLFASTNKVYGGMEDVRIVEKGGRYVYQDLVQGAAESQPLDFHSPYGCSKGAADQYVRDYARIYGIPTLICRMSCIYGTRQMGNEDQGWVAHFVISACLGRPLTIFGDGKQVRDVLFVDDLLDAYQAAVARRERLAGQIFNLGGGPGNTLSLLELLDLLQERLGRAPEVSFAGWRAGDHRVYVSDTRKAQRELDWSPRVSPAEGVNRMVDWVQENPGLFRGD